MSSKSVPPECQSRVSSKSVKQECPAKVSSRSVQQECQARVSRKSVQQECQARVSFQEWLARRCASHLHKEKTSILISAIVFAHSALHKVTAFGFVGSIRSIETLLFLLTKLCEHHHLNQLPPQFTLFVKHGGSLPRFWAHCICLYSLDSTTDSSP